MTERQPSVWLEVRVLAHLLDAEAVAAALEPYSPGGIALEEPLTYRQGDDGQVIDLEAPVAVVTYLSPATAKRWPALRRRLHRLPLARPLRTRCRWLAEEDWAYAWREFFPVLRVGKRLVVRPTWRDYSPREGEVVIHLDPGLAFGTGQHPTTSLCLQALEDLAPDGLRVLDLGTGSGILAIAAAKLGASLVLALDIDPQAVRVAQENVRLNGVAEVVQVGEGSLSPEATRLGKGDVWPKSQEEGRGKKEGRQGGQPSSSDLLPPSSLFDLALANISALAICDLASALAQTLKEGGVAVVSGFTAETAVAVTSCLERAGLAWECTMAEEDWRAIVARKASR